MKVAVVIPALNEERALPLVLKDLPPVDRVVVADNGSTDGTADIARRAGAYVVYESERGYGAACLRALEELRRDPPDVVVFLDADYSDHPDELDKLLAPIRQGEAELVIGSRTRGRLQRGALTPQQRAGNAIACAVLKHVYGVAYTDLGPFRAITWQALQRLEMRDRNFGWTVEMQIKSAQRGVKHTEVAVSYRRRVGESKVSGTLSGTLKASAKILWWLARYAKRTA